jgi:transporter family-2 protein
VGDIVKNARMGNALFWCIGALMAVIIGLSGWDVEFFTKVKAVPPYLFVAGALGASLVFCIAWLMPQIGAGPCTVVMLTGQIISAMIISHFGWLGSPVQPVSMIKIVGTLVMIAGVCMITFAKAPSGS